MPRCNKCGDYHSGQCDPELVKQHEINAAMKEAHRELLALEAELSEFLQTKHGRFELYYASRGKGTLSGSSRM